MINSRLREKTIEVLRCSTAEYYRQVKDAKKRHHTFSRDMAAYVLAAEHHVEIEEDLDPATCEKVGEILRGQVSAAQADVQLTRPAKSGKSVRAERVIQIGTEFRLADPVLSDRVMREAKEMAAIYPLLYVLENSMREAIRRRLAQRYGDAWWDNKAPPGLRKVVEGRMAEDQINAWHQPRGEHEIYYLDLKQLSTLVRHNQNDFVPDVLPSLEWFTSLVEEVYKSRCVLAHMNPLSSDNVKAVKLRFSHWQKQVTARTSAL